MKLYFKRCNNPHRLEAVRKELVSAYSLVPEIISVEKDGVWFEHIRGERLANQVSLMNYNQIISTLAVIEDVLTKIKRVTGLSWSQMDLSDWILDRENHLWIVQLDHLAIVDCIPIINKLKYDLLVVALSQDSLNHFSSDELKILYEQYHSVTNSKL